MFGKCGQFFEDSDGRLSMTRLIVFMSFFPSSFVVLVTRNEAIFGWYVSAYVLGYVGGKTAEIFRMKPPAQPIINPSTPEKL